MGSSPSIFPLQFFFPVLVTVKPTEKISSIFFFSRLLEPGKTHQIKEFNYNSFSLCENWNNLPEFHKTHPVYIQKLERQSINFFFINFWTILSTIPQTNLKPNPRGYIFSTLVLNIFPICYLSSIQIHITHTTQNHTTIIKMHNECMI